MKLLRLALPALLSVFLFVPALAQYPLAWSAFRDLNQHSTEVPLKSAVAPGGGFYLYGDLGNSSQELIKIDGTGAMLWSRCVPGRVSDFASNGTGVVVVG